MRRLEIVFYEEGLKDSEVILRNEGMHIWRVSVYT